MKKYILFFPLLFLAGCGSDSTAPKQIPQITVAPKSSDVTTNSAMISWQTDIAATSVVRYGLTAGQHDLTVRNDNQTSTHTINLLSLKSGQQYYYIAESGTKDGSAASVEFSFTTLYTTDQMFTLAWTAYQQKNYLQAAAYFSNILKESQNNTVALNGLGWCYMATPIDSLGKAIHYFDMAIATQAKYEDALAGRGFAHLALKNYSQVIEDLSSLLQQNPAWSFNRDTAVNYQDVQLALAMAWFYKQDYINCQSMVNKLAPGNGLNRDVSATWTVDGTVYTAYREALLAWLEKLRK